MRGASESRWCAKLAPKGVAVPMARVTRCAMRTAGCVRFGLTWPTALSEDAAPPGAPDPVVATGSLRSVRLPCGLSSSWCSPRAAWPLPVAGTLQDSGPDGPPSTLGATVLQPLHHLRVPARGQRSSLSARRHGRRRVRSVHPRSHSPGRPTFRSWPVHRPGVVCGQRLRRPPTACADEFPLVVAPGAPDQFPLAEDVDVPRSSEGPRIRQFPLPNPSLRR